MEKNERYALIIPSREVEGEEGSRGEWVLLQKHPLFSCKSSNVSSPPNVHSNLIAWDGSSRLYLWDSTNCCLHRLNLRFGDPDPDSIYASSSSKMLHPDIQIHFAIYNISINRTGSSLLLSGTDGLFVMYLYGRASTKSDDIICRTISVGSYFDGSNYLRTLQASWHPYSDSHLGILSSDSVFRLFDLSSDLMQPEQEYFLQPVEPSRCKNAVSICPMAFSFGGEHLWDRFSVFVVFSDGSIYVLCPIVPFGSFYSWTSIEEIYKDAQTFGQKSSNLHAVTSSSFAIAWLEATFPDFVSQEMEGRKLLALKAHPYVPFDASLSLQGPLHKVCHPEDIQNTQARSTECEGRAVSFLYNSISQDSVLLTAWSSGQLQIDALADELQPVWNVGTSPRLHLDSGCITGVSMICESITMEVVPDKEIHMNNMADTVWLGHPPPLLRLAIVDLALPSKAVDGSLISIFADPLVPERIYSLHGSGIDLIVLHFLPFSNQATGKDEATKAPSVYPILTTCQSDAYSPSPLKGFVALGDSFGHSWIVALSSSEECIVMEMKGWNVTLPPLHVDGDIKSISSAATSETAVPDIISKELITGPKVVLTPHASVQRSLSTDSIEGRSTLHHYFKLFHESYVEYAHKVYVELRHHGSYLKRILTDQHERMRQAKLKLRNVEEKQQSLHDRLHCALQNCGILNERLQRFRNLPGPRKRPLSRAEHDFKSQLDRLTGMELDALHSSIEALNARLIRSVQSSPGNALNSHRQVLGRRKTHVPNVQISQLKSALEKLSIVNSENSKKVKLVESALRSLETNN